MLSRFRIGLGLCSLGMLLAAALVLAPRLRAEPLSYPTFELSAGPELRYAVSGARCKRSASDVESCSNLLTYGFELAPRARLSRWFALGGVGRLGWGDAVKALQLAAELRLTPLRAAGVAPWIGLDLGGLLFFDRLTADELGPAHTYVKAVPAAGIGLGLEFELSLAVSAGILLRGDYALSSADAPLTRKPSYDRQLLLSASLIVTIHPGR